MSYVHRKIDHAGRPWALPKSMFDRLPSLAARSRATRCRCRRARPAATDRRRCAVDCRRLPGRKDRRSLARGAERPRPPAKPRRTRCATTGPPESRSRRRDSGVGCPRAVHGRRRMTLTVGKYTFSAWLRQGDRPHHQRTRHARRGQWHGEGARDRAGGRERERAPGAQGFRADGTGRRRRHQQRHRRAHRAARLGDGLRAELSGVHRVLRRGPACGGTRRPRAVGDRLRPWLALAVLEEATDEAHRRVHSNDKRQPLPSITVASTASLPPPTQTWAWAHVHTNEAFADETDFEQFLESLRDAGPSERGPHHQPADEPAAAEGEHALRRVRRSGVRDRPPGGPRTGSSGVSARSSRRGPPRPARWSCRSSTTGASAPARTKTSSRW